MDQYPFTLLKQVPVGRIVVANQGPYTPDSEEKLQFERFASTESEGVKLLARYYLFKDRTGNANDVTPTDLVRAQEIARNFHAREK